LEKQRALYGNAGEYSEQFFDQAQQLVSSTDDPVLRNLLVVALARRDQITADLAKGEGAVLPEVQALLLKLEQNEAG
jgi:hypothetical protein